MTYLDTLAARIKECDDIYTAELHRPLLAEPKDALGLANGVLRLTSEDGAAFAAYLRTSDEYAAKHPPVPPEPERPVAPSVSAPIRANFCGATTPWGEKCFDIFLADWTLTQRQQVYAMKRAAGVTHIVLSLYGDYHGAHRFDCRRTPEAFGALIAEVLNEGFCPIVFLTDGGPDADIATFGPVLRALSAYHTRCHWVPGWETVGPGGAWTSKRFSDAVLEMAKHLPAEAPIWAHLVDNRATFSSWPVEGDDPWQGDEIGAWKSHGGERLAGLLYQSASGRELLQADQEPVGDLGLRGWRNRAWECKIRLVDGYNGWRRVRMCCFETVAEDYYWGRCTDADVARLAREARDLGFTEFGNGVVTA